MVESAVERFHGVDPWYVRTKADRKALEAGYTWDEAAGDKVILFAHTYFKPQYARGKFRLLPWQERFLRSLFSWKHPSGRRRFRRATLHIAKKNGKTMLVSLIALYEAFLSESPSPLVAVGSTSIENARQVFDQAAFVVKGNPRLAKKCRITNHTKTIKCSHNGAVLKCLASNDETSQGWNCSLCILDEVHAHKGRKFFDSVVQSMASREDGLVISISTSGDDPSHFYHAIYSKAKRILSGEDSDDLTTYAEVYEVDEADDFDDPATWAKANPSMPTAFSEDMFAQDLLAARGTAADFLNFQRYRLNVWCSTAESKFLELSSWDKLRNPMTPEQLHLYPCVIALDLSQVEDPSSVAACWALPGERFYVRSWAWVCRVGFNKREAANTSKYTEFIREGSMTLTDGDMIDERRIREFVLELAKANRVKHIVLDPSGAYVLAETLKSHGYEVERWPQTHRYYDQPMKLFERAVKEGRLQHDGKNWLRWCLSNLRMDVNSRGECRPDSSRSVDHIDGAVAAIMSFGRCVPLSQPVAVRTSVYESRGILTV